MRVAVYGAGGHGHDIAATLPDFAGFVDDDPERHELEPLGAYELLLGMNDPQVRYRKWRMTLNFPWHNNGVWVHPSANLGPSVKLGQHTHVNAGAFLTRCTVGEFCTIAPNATVLGDVTLGDRVMVGANATIRNLVTVCSDVVIGAGAVVTKDITEPGTYVGCPAKVVDPLEDFHAGVRLVEAMWKSGDLPDYLRRIESAVSNRGRES